MSENLHDTQFFQTVQENKMDVSQVLELVYNALSEKDTIRSIRSWAM